MKKNTLLINAALAASLSLLYLVADNVIGQVTPYNSTTNAISLRNTLRSFDSNRSTRYIAVFQDLNGDGNVEAIVYLMGENWCGSGGCNTLILTKKKQSWKIISKITISNPPIRVLKKTSNEWHSIGVWVRGGGIQPGYEAELDFNGLSYPLNPSIKPAVRLEKSTGEIVIPSTNGATPLH